MPSKRNQLSGRGGPGGGPASRSLTPKVTTYFGGQPSQRVNPGGADALGQAMGNHSTDSGKAVRQSGNATKRGDIRRPWINQAWE